MAKISLDEVYGSKPTRPTKVSLDEVYGSPEEDKSEGGVLSDLGASFVSGGSSLVAFFNELALGLDEKMEQELGFNFASEELQKTRAERAKKYRQQAKTLQRDSISGTVAQLPFWLGMPAASVGASAADRYNELKESGVDDLTAARSASSNFLVNTAAMALPIGRGLIKGALVGGGSNVAATVLDKGATQLLLKEDYKGLADEYQITKDDLVKSGTFGLVLGGIFGKMGAAGGKAKKEVPKEAEGLFDTLAKEAPEQAEEVVMNIKDKEVQAAYEKRLAKAAKKKPKEEPSEFVLDEERARPARQEEQASGPELEAAVLPEDLMARAETTLQDAPPEISDFDSAEAYSAALDTHSANRVKQDDLQPAFKLEDGTIIRAEKNEPHAVLMGKLPEGAIDTAEAGFVGKSGKFLTRGEAQETYRVSDAADIPRLKEVPDPVVYMNAGIPITRSNVQRAFRGVRGVLQKSEAYKTAEREIQEGVDVLIRNINPEALGPKAKEGAAVVAKTLATQMQKDSANMHQSEGRRTFWNQRHAEVDDFIKRFESGEKFDDPLIDQARRYYQEWNERIAEQDSANGIKYDAKDNYLYHVFEDSEGVANFLFKKYGSKWGDPRFQKERQFELYEEAMKAGFKPKFKNPEEIMLARQHASDVAEMQITTLRDMKTFGLARKPGKGEDRAPGEIFWRAPNGETYMVHQDAAQILHNAFNTKSLWNLKGPVGTAFRGAMWLKNALVPIQLGLSLFHPLHVQTIDNATGMVRASKELLAGKIGPGNFIKRMAESAAYKDIGTGLGTTGKLIASKLPGGDRQGFLKGLPASSGYRLLNVWKGDIPESALTSADKLAIQFMVEGGFIPEMSSQYKNNSIRKFKDALTKRDAKSAVFQAPWAAVEALQKPMFEIWIPALKAASYTRDVQTAIKADPSLLQNTLKRQQAFRKLAKSVDNRYGEMAYSTLFWNRFIKDIGVGSTLSLGWNLGFLREYGGGAMDMGKAITNDGNLAARAKSGDLDRPLFLLYYTAQALAYGGLMTWAMTGKAPSEWMDYVYPKSGDKKPDGSDMRVNTMFYPREFAAIYKHMESEGALSGTGHLLLNKATPVLGMARDWSSNVDYFGNEISDPDAPAYQRLQQKLGHLFEGTMPMSIRATLQSAEKAGRSPTAKDYALNISGFSPAPTYATDTPTEAKIKSTFRRYNSTIRPFERAEYSDQARQLRIAKQQENWDKYNEILEGMEEKYELTSKQVKAIERNLDIDSTVKMFKRLTPDQQTKLLKGMNEEELEKYLPAAAKKVQDNFQ